MSSQPSSKSQLDASLPTLDSLGIDPGDIAHLKEDQSAVEGIAIGWINAFNSFVRSLSSPSPDIQNQLTELFINDAWWRDNLSLTWDIRTFYTLPPISQFLIDRVQSKKVELGKVELERGEGRGASLQWGFEDLVWIQVFGSFETDIGKCEMVIRLVPSSSTHWKSYTLFTSLLSLHAHPPSLGPLRNHAPNHGNWPTDRLRSISYLDREPAVVVIGAGQSGIGVAARLKVLGVDCLVVEKKESVGQQWRDRYEALCLHDPVCKSSSSSLNK